MPADTQSPRQRPGSSARRTGLIFAAILSLLVIGALVFVVVRAKPTISSSDSTSASLAPQPGDAQLNTGKATDPFALSSTAQVGDLLAVSDNATIDLMDEQGRIAQKLAYARLEPLESARVRLTEPRAIIYLAQDRAIEIRAQQGQFLQRTLREEPESGWFRENVRIALFENVIRGADVDKDAKPAAALFTDSLEFDTRTGEIRTDDDLKVESDTITFKGRGATILFSEQDRRLLFLRIDSGDTLTFNTKARAPDKPGAPTEPAPSEPARAEETTRDARQDIYRAVFTGPVRLARAQTALESERLEVWISLLNGSLPPDAVRAISTPVARTSSGVRGVSAKSDDSAPITLSWSGPFEIRPLSSAPPELDRDLVFVRFSSPTSGRVTAYDDSLGAAVECLGLDYGATTRRLTLAGAGPRSVVLKLHDRGEAVASRLEADLGTNSAAFPGPGVLRAAAGDAQLLEPRDVSWRGRCDLAFDFDDRGRIALRRATLSDGVLARDQGREASGGLVRVDFAPTDAANALNVSRVIIEEGATIEAGRDGRLEADRVDIAFAPRGTGLAWSPSVATASGRVHASRSGEQPVSMRAELAEARFGRAPDGTARTESVTADLGVVVRLGDGDDAVEARADRVRALVSQNIAELQGEPASIRRGPGIITGGSMRLDGNNRRLTVFGAGKIEAATGAARQDQLLGYDRVEASWTGSMTFDDLAGIAELGGGVEAIADAGGLSRDTGRGERLLLHITPGSADRSSSPDTREVLHATLIGGDEEFGDGALAEIESRRYEPDQTSETGVRLVRLINLASSRIEADRTEQRLWTPGAGRLLTEDRRASGGKEASRGQGTTLFEWQGSMGLAHDTGDGEMRGRVRVRHLPLNAEEAVELECETLAANFDMQEQILRSAEAREAVYARQGLRQLVADRLTLDAVKMMAHATATPGNAVIVFDEAVGPPATAEAIEWDLTTNRVRATKAGTIRAPR
ncbi:MAG: hypothetical protein AB7G17_02380 [Phycisphaerales bacterium]